MIRLDSKKSTVKIDFESLYSELDGQAFFLHRGIAFSWQKLAAKVRDWVVTAVRVALSKNSPCCHIRRISPEYKQLAEVRIPKNRGRNQCLAKCVEGSLTGQCPVWGRRR